MSHIINAHPQKQQIIGDVMSGLSPGKVAKKYGLNESTVWRFRALEVKPMMQAIDVSKIVPQSDFTNNDKNVSPTIAAMTEARAQVGQSQRLGLAATFVDKIARYDSRRDAMLAITERYEDARAFAAIDGRILSAIELQARLSGALQDQVAPGASIRVVIRADGAVECAASASGPAEDAGECYDIDAQPL